MYREEGYTQFLHRKKTPNSKSSLLDRRKVPDAPLKVSEKLPLSNSDAVHDWEKMFFNVDNEDPDPVAAITDIVLL